jgi:hypothetical protein
MVQVKGIKKVETSDARRFVTDGERFIFSTKKTFSLKLFCKPFKKGCFI